MKHKGIVRFITLIAFTMIFSTTAVSFASVSGKPAELEFQEELLENILLPDDTIVEDESDCEMVLYDNSAIECSATFKKSAGKGKATVQATRVGSKKMTSKIQLQEISPATGKYINSSANAATLSKNGITITHSATFSVSSSKKYRIKVTITANVNGTNVPTTVYCTLK